VSFEGDPGSHEHNCLQLVSRWKLKVREIGRGVREMGEDSQAHIAACRVTAQNDIGRWSLRLSHNVLEGFNGLPDLGRVGSMRYKRVLKEQECNWYIAFLESGLNAVPELEMSILPV
jgi:hypothetical protein